MLRKVKSRMNKLSDCAPGLSGLLSNAQHYTGWPKK